jgi:hypothetical protein
MYEKAKKTQISCVFFCLNKEVRRLPVSLNEVWTLRSTSCAKFYDTANGVYSINCVRNGIFKKITTFIHTF